MAQLLYPGGRSIDIIHPAVCLDLSKEHHVFYPTQPVQVVLDGTRGVASLSPGGRANTYWVRRLGGHQSQSGCCGARALLFLLGIEP
jgi:hypothetical protein